MKQQKTLATPLPLPPALFRRLSNFSIYKVADSIFFNQFQKQKCNFQNKAASLFQYFSTLIFFLYRDIHVYVHILEIVAVETDSAAFGYHFVVTVCIVLVHIFCTLMISGKKIFKHLTFFLLNCISVLPSYTKKNVQSNSTLV